MILNKAELLNRRAGQAQFKAEEILRVLALKKGDVVVDIGSGGGYFTMKFAGEVGLDGRVCAVDTNKKLLAYIKDRAEEKQMTNIRTLLDKDSSKIPEQGCDLIFLRNVFHHLNEREHYFKNLKRYLKPEGRVAIIDYKKRRTLNLIALVGHHVEESTIREVMNNAGYAQTESYNFLPEQSFSVYRMA